MPLDNQRFTDCMI